MLRVFGLVLAFAASVGCGRNTGTADAGPTDAGADARLTHHTGLSGTHVASCDDPVCGEDANPPLGGPHCPTLSPCRAFAADQPVKKCNWVHNLEHGHVVLLYNCPGGCDELVAHLTQLWQDARAAGNSRVLLTADPTLASTVAAVVWGWGWSGDQFDEDAIRAVMAHQDEDAPERGLGCAP